MFLLFIIHPLTPFLSSLFSPSPPHFPLPSSLSTPPSLSGVSPQRSCSCYVAMSSTYPKRTEGTCSLRHMRFQIALQLLNRKVIEDTLNNYLLLPVNTPGCFGDTY